MARFPVNGGMSAVRDKVPPVDLPNLLPSGGDDTARINSAVLGGRPLGEGTFLISSEVSVPANMALRGPGSALTTLKCTAAAGGVSFGPVAGSVPQNNSGINGGFTIDGNSTSTRPLLRANCVNTTFEDLTTSNGLNDGTLVLGQNCTFIGWASGNNDVDLAFDNGSGGNYFIKPEMHGGASTRWNVEFRESTAPAVGSYNVPTLNFLIGGIAEFNTLGCVHLLAGNLNYFDLFNFFTNALTPLVKLEPNTVLGRSADQNNGWHFRDCAWTGNGVAPASNGQYGIQASSVSAGVGQPFPSCDRLVVLEGEQTFSGLEAALDWECNSPIILFGPEPPLYNMTTVFKTPVATGTPIWFQFETDGNHAPTFLHGWANYGGGFSTAAYTRERGRVHLLGTIASGTMNQSAFQLPVGYRPGSTQVYAVASGVGATSSGSVLVDATGNVAPNSGSNVLITLDGISFEHSTYA